MPCLPRWADFVQANTRMVAPPLVPEIVLHLAEQSLPIWQKTEVELQASNVPPPYWAFAWAGGQALARYLLDHPELVARRTVTDLGSGSGLAAIAAKMAGAAEVVAAEIDPLARAAITLNAAANGVTIVVTEASPPFGTSSWPDIWPDIMLVGDLFYERELAQRVLGCIETAAAAGALVLIGDPERMYFPKARFEPLAEYSVPVSRELEDADIKRTAVWRLARPQPG